MCLSATAGSSIPRPIEVDGKGCDSTAPLSPPARARPSRRFTGLREAGYYTNETIFTLTELPRRLAVIGAGPIGCELAQSFQRFGSAVTIAHRRQRRFCRAKIATRRRLSAQQIEKDGVTIITGAKIHSATSANGGEVLDVKRR